MKTKKIFTAKEILIGLIAVCIFIIMLILLILGQHGKGPAAITQSTPTQQPTAVTPRWDGEYYDENGDIISDFSEIIPDTSTIESIENVPEHYNNINLRSFTLANGAILHLGLGRKDIDDALYFNPSIELPNTLDPTQFILYINEPMLRVEYTQMDVRSPQDLTSKLCIALGQTYDTCIPAGYTSEGFFGAKYIGDAWADEDGVASTVSMRIIDVSKSELVDIVHVNIMFDKDSETYSFGEIESGNVRRTNLVTEDQYNQLISESIEFLRDPKRGPALSIQNEETWSYAKEHVIIEQTEAPYFFTFIAPDNQSVLKRGKYIGKELYVVNLPVNGHGFLTIYFIPELQSFGFSKAEDIDGTKKLIMLGYDAPDPFTNQTLIVPRALQEDFF